ncbi:hydantoinase/oxoprolinase family protein [Xanthobacter agilis]|uniref:H4MPT-linked C1 transfer pathway protein n=1 Tax=Xanthobacter agilis TaxID=47492 RepID=A0ABU0LER7_XANAG|nr:hydantoinase/oxoprolinase family protein [Xanthobacter agilis]MDQ0505645.1 putative H4MPT-linked C1 transfer pathway protein [Xanthobacter agilis]
MSAADLLLGWDVGGAHLKRAVLDASGRLLKVDMAPCALWLGLDRLDAALAALPPAPDAPSVVTMTGELTDLWPDRITGVVGLADALAARLGEDTLFYAGPQGFVPRQGARANAESIASANWHATAAALALRLPAGVLVDIGSTTSDILYFADEQVRSRGYTDSQRMVAGELLYSGVARTPAMAFGPTLPFRGIHVPLMMEYFANMADVHRLTGELPERADLHPAADGGAKTREASARRLLRMVGRDLGPCSLEEAEALAAYASEVQVQRLHSALALVISAHRLPPAVPLVGAGVGRFLAAKLAARTQRWYLDAGRLLAANDTLAGAAADCAPAVAVALLARRQGL